MKKHFLSLLLVLTCAASALFLPACSGPSGASSAASKAQQSSAASKKASGDDLSGEITFAYTELRMRSISTLLHCFSASRILLASAESLILSNSPSLQL